MHISVRSAKSKLVRLFAMIVVGFFSLASAHADPITINGVSGIATIVNSSPSVQAMVNISGDSFSANVNTLNGLFVGYGNAPEEEGVALSTGSLIGL